MKSSRNSNPDIEIEHGSSRVTVDLSAWEWVIVTVLTAIVGMIVYILN